MRIEMDRFSFEAPPGFEDTTDYTFKDQKEQELLTISFGARPQEATSLRKLMALRRGNLNVVVPGAAKIEKESDTRVDGMPGRMLVFTFEDRDMTFRERWAVALPTPDLYLQISYVARAGDAQAEQRFSHICQSVVPVRKSIPRESPAGYARQWARRMTLDVPVTLSPPRVYQFAAKDNSEVRLTVRYQDPQRPAGAMPSPQQDMAQDAARGAIGNQQSKGITGVQASGSLTRYSITPPGGAESLVYTTNLLLRNAVQLRASIRGPAVMSGRLEQVITSFIQTVTAK